MAKAFATLRLLFSYHRVLQGQRGGAILLHFCGSPDPFFMEEIQRGEKTPTPKISALLRKRPVLLKANLNFVLTKARKRPKTTDIFVVKNAQGGVL